MSETKRYRVFEVTFVLRFQKDTATDAEHKTTQLRDYIGRAATIVSHTDAVEV